MSKYYILFLAILILESCKEYSKEESNRVEKTLIEPIVIKENIEPFFSTRHLDSLIANSKLTKVESHIVVEQMDTLLIELFYIPNWSDPGDYLNIKISKNGIALLDEKNFGGWVNLFNPKLEKFKSKMKSKNILLVADNAGYQIILLGYNYASTPELMTIIDLFPKPQVIFNKNFYLDSIEFDNEGYATYLGSTDFDNSIKLNTKTMIILE